MRFKPSPTAFVSGLSMKAMMCVRCVRSVPTNVRNVGMRLRNAAVIQRLRNFVAEAR